MSDYREQCVKAKDIRRNVLPQKEYDVLHLEKKNKNKKHYSVQHKINPALQQASTGLRMSWCKDWFSYSNYHTLKDAEKALAASKKGWLGKWCIFRIVKDGVPVEE